MKTPSVLCILDGFGLNPNSTGNAIAAASKPNFDTLWATCPHTTLITFGERVGLPEGQMGNSEVGHLNIGAGRVVPQWLLRINRALQGSEFALSPAYQKFRRNFAAASKIHVLGLLSAGGVHSHEAHAFLLIQKLHQEFAGEILVHLFTDGRDCPPQSASQSLRALLDVLEKCPRARIASVSGRFFAMDRDKRWDRTEKAYRAIAEGQGTACASILNAIEQSYAQGITDEFLEPLVFSHTGIDSKDLLVCWNFREDRMRQLLAALVQPHFEGFTRKNPALHSDQVLTFTEYDHNIKVPYLFEPLDIRNHLGEYLASLGLTQLRVAETEKYPHVTYFLNGGIEAPYAGEDRKVIPSPRDVKTYDLKPEMSAIAVTDIVVQAVEQRSHDFIVVNLANCDMVGHTGVFEAAVKAVETVDSCLGRIVSAVLKAGGKAMVIADHGNAEQMIDYQTGAPHTAHTTYPVPCILIGADSSSTLRKDGALCDVAPTMLKLMGLEVPAEMSGESL